MKEKFDFYSKTSLKSYNLNKTMRYQLSRLDALDVFTRKHCEDVANVTCRLCENLGLNQSFTVYCTTCAYLHDVGKIFIPSAVLQKSSQLTPEEYEIMKTHVIKGYKMCMEDLQLRPYVNGVLYHHEGLDGSGYPNNVTVDDIPLEGQIIRVADEYDAIVNKRQYKSHIGISDTLKLLISDSNPNPIPKEEEKNYDKKYVKVRKKYGKINKKILAALLNVVLYDINYEIDCISEYTEYLTQQIDRLNTIKNFHEKMDKAPKQSKKDYFLSGINELLEPNETLANYKEILDEYEAAHKVRQDKINDLKKEINIINHLKI